MSLRLAAWSGGGLLILVLLGGLGWGLLHPANGNLGDAVGGPAPEVVIHSLDGQTVRLSQFHGRPVVLNFWASWCVPCHEEEPALRAAASQFSTRVAFLGVDIQDSLAAAQADQAQAQLPYPVGPPASAVPTAYGVTAPPETYFINAGGTVVARFLGPLDANLITRYLGLAGVEP